MHSLCCYLCSFLFHFQRLVIESNNNVICVPCPQFFVLFLPCIFAFIQVILEFWVQNHLVGQINQITFTKILPLFVVHCSLWSKYARREDDWHKQRFKVWWHYPPMIISQIIILWIKRYIINGVAMYEAQKSLSKQAVFCWTVRWISVTNLNHCEIYFSWKIPIV